VPSTPHDAETSSRKSRELLAHDRTAGVAPLREHGAHRGGSNASDFRDDPVPGWSAPGKTDEANKGAWENSSPLEIEDINEGAFPKRK
jgi:hypothetical protein